MYSYVFYNAPIYVEFCSVKTVKMAELSKEQKRDFAQNLYLNEKCITQKEIATRVGVTEATVCRWIKQYGWECMRTSLMTTKDEQLSMMYNQLAAANQAISSRDEGQRFATSKEADALLKTTAAIKNLEVEANIGDKMSVGREFLAFVRRTSDFNTSKAIGVLFDSYIKSNIR